MAGCRPKDVPRAERHFSLNPKPRKFRKSLSVGCLAGNQAATEMDSKKQHSRNQNASNRMGCRPKVLPSRSENVLVGQKSKDLASSKKVRTQSSCWDLTQKLRKVTAELKESQNKEKGMEEKLHKLSGEIEVKEQLIESIKLSLPDKRMMEIKDAENMIVRQELEGIEQLFFQKQGEVEALENEIKSNRQTEVMFCNVINELRERMLFLKENTSFKDSEILKVKSDTEELNRELGTTLERFKFYESMLQSISSEVEILENCKKSMEMCNISAMKGLSKSILRRK